MSNSFWLRIFTCYAIKQAEGERYLLLGVRLGTLHALALRYQRSVNDLVHTLQGAIQVYRRHHPYKHKA